MSSPNPSRSHKYHPSRILKHQSHPPISQHAPLVEHHLTKALMECRAREKSRGRRVASARSMTTKFFATNYVNDVGREMKFHKSFKKNGEVKASSSSFSSFSRGFLSSSSAAKDRWLSPLFPSLTTRLKDCSSSRAGSTSLDPYGPGLGNPTLLTMTAITLQRYRYIAS